MGRDEARDAIRAWLQAAVEQGAIPGAAWVVARGRVVLDSGVVGWKSLVPRRSRLRPGTIYDLASLTKPLATAALAVRLTRDGRLRLEEAASRFLPEIEGSPYARVTLLDLLLHRSGLPAWEPLFLHGGDMAAYAARISRLPPVALAGARVVYSDPGYFLAGEAVARAGGRPLDALFRREILGIFDPVPAEPRFRPPRSWRPRIAPTESGDALHRELVDRHAGPAAGAGWTGWREAVLRGEVHDHNARALGGVAGNAGLFGSAGGVAALAAEFLPGSRLFEPAELSLFSTSRTAGLEQERGVGFRLATSGWAAAGEALSPRSFGHTGFTGTSLMLDPVSGGVYVLLTNRIHPFPRQVDLTAIRCGFHARSAALLAVE